MNIVKAYTESKRDASVEETKTALKRSIDAEMRRRLIAVMCLHAYVQQTMKRSYSSNTTRNDFH